MDGMKRLFCWWVIILIVLTTACPSDAQRQDEQRLYVLGTEVAIGLARDFLSFLSNEGIPTVTVTGQFEQFAKEKYLVVLGGPNEPGGLGEFVKKILTPEEQAEVSQAKKGRMFVKENVFVPGQAIIVFAGVDAETSADVRKKNRGIWMGILGKWFDIEFTGTAAY